MLRIQGRSNKAVRACTILRLERHVAGLIPGRGNRIRLGI